MEDDKGKRGRRNLKVCEKKEEEINTSRNIIGKVMKRRKKITVCYEKRQNYRRGV